MRTNGESDLRRPTSWRARSAQSTRLTCSLSHTLAHSTRECHDRRGNTEEGCRGTAKLAPTRGAPSRSSRPPVLRDRVYPVEHARKVARVIEKSLELVDCLVLAQGEEKLVLDLRAEKVRA